MGILNSSKYRVAPVFDALRSRDKTSTTWLATLLSLPSRPDRESLTIAPSRLGSLEAAAWNSLVVAESGWEPKERRLPAPRGLLEILIDTITEPRPTDAWGKGDTRVFRKRLAEKHKPARKEAKRLLAGPSRPNRWEVLEGPSCPDVYLQTTNAIVVIEGKFTERKPTEYTTWLSGRHQMLRHIDAAYEQRGSRSVYGFFIVEDANAPGWVDAVSKTLEPRAIATSLPHRNEMERASISDSFLGLTTWARVCEATGLPVSLLKSEAALRNAIQSHSD